MGLTCVEDLKTADLFGDLYKTFGVVQEEAGAFVGCDATRKAEGENVRIEVMPGALGNGAEEAKLALVVSCGDAGGVDAIDRPEVLIVCAPVWNLFVEEFLKVGGEPGGGVNAVGDGVDLVAGKHLLGDLAVLHGDAIDES